MPIEKIGSTDPDTNAPTVVSVHVGPIMPLGPDGVPSAFVKQAVEGRVAAGALGLAGDNQADLTVHGGPDKAIYGYAVSHYARWRAEYPQHAHLLIPGGMGENLPLTQLDETTVCLGDIVRVGDAELQVTQPRQPCFKFSLRFADNRMPRAMVQSGRSGWYYRVLTPGTVGAGDRVARIERLNPRWSVARLNELMRTKAATADNLTELADLPGLSSGWQETAREALSRHSSAPGSR